MRRRQAGFTFTHFLLVMIVVGLGSMFWRWATEDVRATKDARWDIILIQPML
jgi:Tfp pilus assembly protein PilX